MFKNNAQRRAVMMHYNSAEKVNKMQQIRDRWSKRNEEKFKRGEVHESVYKEEDKNIKGGEYDEYIEKEADFLIKNKIQVPPLNNGEK